ncbi:hypothetical protein PsorP6_012493 [Peronosclerospora sorghi]|uniref:Uncharacterized protein n=1 Tax=Peronosclerospora sorghi TaxID=230839 RepID=A0ACC0WFH1_9STRA|nr:hypothetical protein PsorP6_012493 [Peronosclerospora sorghi]
MTNVNDMLMRGAKGKGSTAVSKQKKSRKKPVEMGDGKKMRSAASSSWLSPGVQCRAVKSTITPRSKLRVPPTAETRTTFLNQPLASKQSYLDLGQESFGKHVTCPVCGLLYTAGEEEDEKEHRRFCRERKRGVTLSKRKTERIVKAFPDTRARIVELRGDDPVTRVKKLLEIKTVLDDVLGFVEEQTFLKRSHFVYIQETQVVGVVNIERITKAYPLDKSTSSMEKQPRADEHDSVAVHGTLSTSATSQAAIVGICQLWVHPSFRRRNIATRLVDVVREKSIYGMRIAKNLVAFAQPTQNGLQFAQTYVVPGEVLIY